MNLTWFGWLWIVWLALAAVISIGQIGKEREPITHGLAIATAITSAIMIVGFLTVGANR